MTGGNPIRYENHHSFYSIAGPLAVMEIMVAVPKNPGLS